MAVSLCLFTRLRGTVGKVYRPHIHGFIRFHKLNNLTSQHLDQELGADPLSLCNDKTLAINSIMAKCLFCPTVSRGSGHGCIAAYTGGV